MVGCADLKLKPGLDITRDEITAEIVCEATGETWFLVCRGNQWIGEIPSDCPVQASSRSLGGVFLLVAMNPLGSLKYYGQSQHIVHLG